MGKFLNLEFLVKTLLLIAISFLLLSCGPPEYKNLTLLKNYSDDLKYTKVNPGENGAPLLEDIVGERFYNLFILRQERNAYTYSNKTYEFRATITKNSDNSFKIKTGPIRFGSMPIAPVFEFSRVSLVKLENGAYSFVALVPGTGTFRSLPTETNPEGFIIVNYDNIKLVYAGTEIAVVKNKTTGKKQTVIKFSLDFKQEIKTLPSGWLNVQEVVTKDTKGFENASEDAIYNFNSYNKNLILAAREMATSMKGAAGTHCDYRIEFQGYRLKYTGIKTRPYLFNFNQAKFKRLPKTKICARDTTLKGKFLSLDYRGLADVEVVALDAKTNQPLLNSQGMPISATTNATGTFEISSKNKSQDSFKGGFFKLRFKYKDSNNTVKYSYYPSETNINKKSTLIKMSPNSILLNLNAQKPSTSIRVKPLAFGLGITGNHKVFLYKNTPGDTSPKEQVLQRNLAVDGSDRTNGYYDYTVTFKNLEAGTYYIKIQAIDINQDFWYIGTDKAGNPKIINSTNTSAEAAPIIIEKDQKLKIYPTLGASLITQFSSSYGKFTVTSNYSGLYYDYRAEYLDINNNPIYPTGNWGNFRNIIAGTSYKVRVKRRICTNYIYVEDKEANRQDIKYINCLNWGDYQWVEQALVYGHLNYKVSMTKNPSQAKIFKLNSIEAGAISTPDKPLTGVGGNLNAHLIVYGYNENLD